MNIKKIIMDYLFLNYQSYRILVVQILSTLISFSVLRTLIFFQIRWKRFKLFEYYKIPMPKLTLLDGHYYLYKNERARYKIDEMLKEKYGSFYGIFLGDEPSIVVSDLELVKKVFLEKMSSFKERTETFIDVPVVKSILFAKHDRWKVTRRIMSPTFNSYAKRGTSSTKFVEESIRLMLDYLKHKFMASDDKSTLPSIEIDIHDLMKATTLHTISEMAINLPNAQVRECDPNVMSLDSFLSNVDRGFIEHALRFSILKPVLSFMASNFEHNSTLGMVRRRLNAKIDKKLRSLARGIKEGKNPPLIDTLIRLHYEGKLTRDEVLGNAEAILFAGYDTTSTTLSYLFWVLGKHLDVQEKLRNELIVHGLESQYFEQVINESMRMYPSGISFTTRLATETVDLGPFTVPQGARIVVNSWLIHRNPEIWPKPDNYDPERFKIGNDIHPCAFIPFGLGDRKCLGYQLAKLEVKMVTCDVLMRYRLKTKSPDDLQIVSYTHFLTKPRDKIVIEMIQL